MRARTKFKWAAAAIVLLAAVIATVGALTTSYRGSNANYELAHKAARDLLDGWAGCKIQYPPLVVMGATGEPCGDPWRPKSEEGHSATAYYCPDGGGMRWEIHIERPGDLHDQTCIVAHELGHVLGMSDGGPGIMNQYECPDYIRLTDLEAKIAKEWCF